MIPKPISEIDVSHIEDDDKVPNYEYNGYNGLPTGPAASVDHEFKRVVLDDCITEGFITGAVVVSKSTPKDARMRPIYWGIIIHHNPLQSPKGSVWKPVRVKWINGNFEDCHAQGLIVMINPPASEILLRRANGDAESPGLITPNNID